MWTVVDYPPVSLVAMKLAVLKAKMAQHYKNLWCQANSRTEQELGNRFNERTRVDSGVRPH